MMTNWIGKDDDTPSLYRSKRFGIYLDTAFRQGLNILVFSAGEAGWRRMQETAPDKRRIDVWWRGDATSRLMILFAHMIASDASWHGAGIRVLDVSADARVSGKTVADLEKTLSEIRIKAEPEIVASASSDAVAAYSKDSALVFLPFRLLRQEPTDPFGNPLSGILSRLPVTIAVLAAIDIDLSAEPESGHYGEIAETMDRLNEVRSREKEAEREAQKASEEADEAFDAWRRAMEEGKPDEAIEDLHREGVNAKNRAVQAGRRAAGLAARAEELARRARELGADIAEEEENAR
jgi:hypothetical protein